MALTTRRTAGADETLPAYFWAAAAICPQAVAMRWKHLGIWDNISWGAYADNARAAGCALLACGVARGEVVAVVADARPESLYLEFGTLGVGALPVSICANYAAAALAHELHDCSARVLFVENEEQLTKALTVLDTLPALQKIVYLDGRGLHAFEHPLVVSFEVFIATGRQYHAAHPERWTTEVAAARPDDVALIVYTAGTTGTSKGVMLSHRNLLVQLDALSRLIPAVEGDFHLSFLPMGYLLERCIGMYRSITHGTVVHMGEGMPAVIENLREVCPDVVLAVPRVWEKLHSVVTMAYAKATPFGQWGYRKTLELGRRLADYRLAAQPVPLGLRLLDGTLRFTLRRRILGLIGLGNARCLVSSATPISGELVRWYESLGLPMVEVYGLAETAGYAAVCGVAGAAAAAELQIKLAPDGEILVRGQHVFKAYQNQPEQFAQSFVGDWLRTGDTGVIDVTGTLSFMGRKGDTLILADGTRVAPAAQEARLKLSPYVSDAVIVGQGRTQLGCLVMIDHDAVARFAQERNIPFSNFLSLTRASEVLGLIQEEIDQANRSFDDGLKVGPFELVAADLTAGDEVLTPALGLRRRMVLQRHAELIEGMYTRQGAYN